jgi:hypothetical protein
VFQAGPPLSRFIHYPLVGLSLLLLSMKRVLLIETIFPNDFQAEFHAIAWVSRTILGNSTCCDQDSLHIIRRRLKSAQVGSACQLERGIIESSYMSTVPNSQDSAFWISGRASRSHPEVSGHRRRRVSSGGKPSAPRGLTEVRMIRHHHHFDLGSELTTSIPYHRLAIQTSSDTQATDYCVSAVPPCSPPSQDETARFPLHRSSAGIERFSIVRRR